MMLRTRGLDAAARSRHRPREHGIFCLEGEWWGTHDRTTVEPALSLLRSYSGLQMPYLHRDVATRPELFQYLDKWSQRGMARYPILYLGFHGSPGEIYREDRRRGDGTVTLVDLEDRLAGRCGKRLIYFASCGTVGVHGQTLNKLLRRTEAVAVVGYRADIDWIEAAAFDVLALGLLSGLTLTRQGLTAWERRVRERASGLARRLELRVHL